MFTAIPARMISVFSFSAKKPIMNATSAPMSIAAITPASQLCVQYANSAPNSAEIIMMPSRPMFEQPAFSDTTAPSAAKRIGAVMRRIEKKNAVCHSMEKNLLMPSRLLPQPAALL